MNQSGCLFENESRCSKVGRRSFQVTSTDTCDWRLLNTILTIYYEFIDRDREREESIQINPFVSLFHSFIVLSQISTTSKSDSDLKQGQKTICNERDHVR